MIEPLLRTGKGAAERKGLREGSHKSEGTKEGGARGRGGGGAEVGNEKRVMA